MLPGLHPWGRQWPVATSNPVNRRHPAFRGRLCWLLGVPGLTGGKTFWDLSGKQSHGAITAATWAGSTRPGGRTHLAFGGGTSVVTVPWAPNFTSNSTVGSVAWWMHSTQSAAGYNVLFTRADVFNSIEGFTVICDQTTGRVRVQFKPLGATSADITGTTNVQDGIWHHVAVTFGTVAVAIYVDGRQEATAAPGVWNFNNWPLLIGNSGDSFWTKFIGKMDDFTWLDRALTAAEVFSFYTLSRLGYPGVLNRTGPPPATGSVSATVVTTTTRRHSVSRGDGTVNTQNHVGRR